MLILSTSYLLYILIDGKVKQLECIVYVLMYERALPCYCACTASFR